MRRMVLIGAAAAFAVMTAWADEPAAGENDAQALFHSKCAICHGKDGKGATKMGQMLAIRDYTDPKVQETLKDEDMTKAIKEGIKKDDKTTMKAFGDKLTDDQIKSLVTYVRSLKAK